MRRIDKYLPTFVIVPLAVLLCASLAAHAQEMSLHEINPIMSFEEQTKRLNAECRGKENDPTCEKKREQLHELLQELRALCRETPHDDRCGAIRRERPVSRLKQFCLENPFEYKCVRRRELHKIREKRKRKYCAKNPDATRCESRSARGSSVMTMAEYCKVHPKTRRCVDRKRRADRENRQKEPETNTF